MTRFLFVFLIFSVHVFAQKEIVKNKQNLLWTRYHLSWNVNKQWTWVNEADNRVFFSNFHKAQFIGHSHLHYKIDSVKEASMGFTFSSVNPVDPDKINPLSVPEIRLFQEFYLKQKLRTNWGVQHRFRLEERFFRNNDGFVLTNGHNFNWRYRYQLMVNFMFNKYINLKASDEIFLNSGKNIVYNTFDSNRIYFAVNLRLMKGLSSELGYLKSFQQSKDGRTYIDRDNVRFTLFHVLEK